MALQTLQNFHIFFIYITNNLKKGLINSLKGIFFSFFFFFRKVFFGNYTKLIKSDINQLKSYTMQSVAV